MQESKKIFKLTVSENGELTSEFVSDLKSPNSDAEKPCFYIKDETQITILKNCFTSLFNENYFQVKRYPVIVFKTLELETLFKIYAESIGFNNFETIIDKVNKNFISFTVKQSDFQNLWDSKTSGTKYFVAEGDIDFKSWLNSVDETVKNRITQNYRLQLQVEKQEAAILTMREKLNLTEDSLTAVKSEYAKELNWYKTEIENIKSWYNQEHEKTPSLVTKFFKKLF